MRTKRRDLGYKTPSQQAGVSKNPKANDRYHPTTQPTCTYPACFCPYLSVVISYCSSPCPRALPSPPFPCPPGEGHLLQTPYTPELPACSQGSCDALTVSSCPRAAAQERLQLNLFTSKPVPCSPTQTPNRRSLVLPPHAEVHQAMCWICTLKGIQRHQSAAARFVFQRELWQHAGASHAAQSRHLVICRDTMNCAHKTLGTSADSAPESKVLLPVLLCYQKRRLLVQDAAATQRNQALPAHLKRFTHPATG